MAGVSGTHQPPSDSSQPFINPAENQGPGVSGIPVNSGSTSPQLSGDVANTCQEGIREQAGAISARLLDFEKEVRSVEGRLQVLDTAFQQKLESISLDNEAQVEIIRGKLAQLEEASNHLTHQLAVIRETSDLVKDTLDVYEDTMVEINPEASDVTKESDLLHPDELEEELDPIEPHVLVNTPSRCPLTDVIINKFNKFIEIFRQLWKTIARGIKTLMHLMELGIFSRDFWIALRMRYSIFTDPLLLHSLSKLGFNISKFDEGVPEGDLLPDLNFDRFSNRNFVSEAIRETTALLLAVDRSGFPKEVKARLTREIEEKIVAFDAMTSPTFWGITTHLTHIAGNLEGLLKYCEKKTLLPRPEIDETDN